MLIKNIGTLSMALENKKVDVLDNGFVRYIDHMGSDLMVVNAARVSFNKESSWDYTDSEFPQKSLSERDKKLIGYLAKHNHWTPFGHPQISLHIKAPIFVRTQLFKHKVGMVENEVSRRYVKDPPEYYIPFWRSAPTDGAKQGSGGFVKYPSVFRDLYQNVCDDAVDAYKHLIDEGIAPEQARAVLPQGTFTEWYWTGSLAAFARIFKQRSDPHAQWEVQQYAKGIGEIISEIFPESWKVLIES